jgi:hypothetical protein
MRVDTVKERESGNNRLWVRKKINDEDFAGTKSYDK